MSLKKKILALFVVIIILLQFYPAQKPEVIFNNPNDLTTSSLIPEDVSILLKRACYDCHSNETKFPWYAKVAPSKWIVYKHINEGKEELNFSEWELNSKSDKAELLDEISTVLMDGEMPLEGYVLLHSEAKLTEAEKETIINWTDDLLESLYE